MRKKRRQLPRRNTTRPPATRPHAATAQRGKRLRRLFAAIEHTLSHHRSSGAILTTSVGQARLPLVVLVLVVVVVAAAATALALAIVHYYLAV